MLRVHISTEMNLNTIIRKNKCGSISSSCTPKIQSCFMVCVIEISYADAHARVLLPFVLKTQTSPFVSSQGTHFHRDVSTLARILSCFSPVMMCFMCLLHALLLSSIEPASLHLCMCLQISSYLKQEHKNCNVLPIIAVTTKIR